MTIYKTSTEVPTEVLVKRLKELSNAVAEGNKEFYMSIPARVDHDADIVISEAAKRLEFYKSYFEKINQPTRNSKNEHNRLIP